MDYADPAQRALLVEGIRPVLPLIRNTPYGKRIQNKLQREQMDHFGGAAGYHNPPPMVNLALGSQGMGTPHMGGGRHMPQHQHQANHLADVYGGQNGMYPQASYNQVHLASQLHALPQSIDGYILQGNSGHNQGISPSHSHGGGFNGASFANVSSFGGAGLPGDPYQRSTFGGYGM